MKQELNIIGTNYYKDEKYHYRQKHFSIDENCDDTYVYNKDFYVDIFSDKDTVEKVVDTLLKTGFVSAIPVMENDDKFNHETCIKFKLNMKSFEAFNYMKQYIDRVNEKYAENSELYKSILNTITEAIENVFKQQPMDNRTYFINMVDSIFNQHRMYLQLGSMKDTENKSETPVHTMPIFESCACLATTNKQDHQINFGTKVSGNVSATYAECPICFDKYLMVQIPGSGANLTLSDLTLSYLGSIFTPDMFEDYSRFRFTMDISFKPFNKLFVCNSEAFEHFDKLISTSKANVPSNMNERWFNPISILTKMKSIKLVLSGKESKQEDVTDVICGFIKTLISTLYGSWENRIDIDSYKKYIESKINYDSINYVIDVDVPDLIQSVPFSIVTW